MKVVRKLMLPLAAAVLCIFIIRHYVLADDLGTNAKEGVLWLFDPQVNQMYEWNVGSLFCTEHGRADGLEASTGGLHHAVRVPVPASLMSYAGEYRFVLHIEDDHPYAYRSHERRWARDLNGESDMVGMAIWTQSGGLFDDTVSLGELASKKLWTVSGRTKQSSPGYRPYKPPGDPMLGGSGLMTDVRPFHALRTLNRLAPGDIPLHAKYCTKNAVWAYFGHSNADLLAMT